MTFLDWIETTKPEGALTAIVAAVIGLATWRIAWVQKEIAKEKVISDLFDRRYQAYEAFFRTNVDIVVHRDWKNSEDIKNKLSDLIYVSGKTTFLFGEDVNDRFVIIAGKLLDFYNIVKNSEKENISVDIVSHALQSLESSLPEDLENMHEIMEKYMKIKDFRNSNTHRRKFIFNLAHKGLFY